MARTVLVTGGSDGIGLSIAQEFSRRGDTVIIVHRSPASSAHAKSEAGAKFCIASDLAEPGGVEKVVEQLDREGITIVDVLVNNAGIRLDRLARDSPIGAHAERAQLLFQTNFVSAFLLTIALMERLASPGGRIVNVTSRALYVGGDPAYAASKAALASLQVTLAEPLGARGITINSVSPGFVPSTGFFRGRLETGRVSAEEEASPLGKVGQPADIARAVAFLADDANGYITGQSLRVDGGGTIAI